MKGHTGATMSMGSESIYSTSSGQKLVARSSTESDLIGVHDVMPQVIWTFHFLNAQGQNAVENVVYQDNKSLLLLEKNGRQSCGKRTRHIDIRYFFVKDRVYQGEVCLEYCPTADKLADFFTKPLQGNLFYKFRDRIMNIDSNSQNHSSHRSVLKVSMHNSNCVDNVIAHANLIIHTVRVMYTNLQQNLRFKYSDSGKSIFLVSTTSALWTDSEPM
jgi:hypothetical protein